MEKTQSNQKNSQSQKNTTTKTGEVFAAWKDMMSVHKPVELVENAIAELSELESVATKNSNEAIDEMAKLAKSSVEFGTRWTELWRRQSLDVLRRSTDTMKNMWS